ncbi:MAG: hypothetical protein OXG22_11840 [Chloroflexi bacterium]|nr:hypothetical protein [Chloroflexota bacterium]
MAITSYLRSVAYPGPALEAAAPSRDAMLDGNAGSPVGGLDRLAGVSPRSRVLLLSMRRG